MTIESSSFTKIDQTGRPRPAVRILNVPIVLRHDTNEAPNNRKGTKLFGNINLVRLPSRVDAKDLHDFVKRVVPQEKDYTVHFVDGQVSLFKYNKLQKQLANKLILILFIFYYKRDIIARDVCGMHIVLAAVYLRQEW